MRGIAAACVLMFIATPAPAQFELDIPSREFNRMIGNVTISDLAVNERGYVNWWSVCAEDGGLFAMGRSLLSAPSDSGRQLIVRRLPANKVEVSIHVGTGESDARGIRETTIRAIAGSSACAHHRLSRPDFELLQIQSIDGFETLSELVRSQG